MALSLIETTVILDLYDHDTTPATIKAIALDSKTRYVAALIRNGGRVYDIGANTQVTLTVLRPDGVGAQVVGEPYAHEEQTPDEQTITTYGAYAELSQTALAVKGKCLAQFKLTSGEQVLRTEIFAINTGRALDADTTDWAGIVDGHNLDEMAESIAENTANIGALETDVDDLKEDLNTLYGSALSMSVYDWHDLASSADNHGFRTGYYNKSDGGYTSSPNFICTNDGIDISDATRVVLVPPTGFSICAALFKADGTTFTVVGEANSRNYPEYIDKPVSFTVGDYVKCFVSVGNYQSATPSGAQAAASEEHVNSIKMYLYKATENKNVNALRRETESICGASTIEGLFKQGGYARNGGALGITSPVYPAYITTADYLPEEVLCLRTSGEYYITAFSWANEGGEWAGFLCDEYTPTTNRYADIYWTQEIWLSKLRELNPNLNFRIMATKASTIAGDMTDITPSEAVNITAYVAGAKSDIQQIYNTEMVLTIASARAAISEPSLVFPLITDIHYQSLNAYADDSISNIKKFVESVRCDFVLNLGDDHDGNMAQDTTLALAYHMRDRFAEIDLPYFHAVGNHDLNGYSSTVRFDSGQIFSAYLSNTKGVHYSMAAGEKDYYVDFDELGIRLIVLDSNHNATYTFSENTGSWLAETALDTNYIVIVASHMSPINSQNWSNHGMANSAGVITALQDFVTNGGTVIQFCGHSHADYAYSTPWLGIFSNCQKFEQSDATDSGYSRIVANADYFDCPPREEGTATEDCWSVVVVKPISRTVDIIRFGAGNDRSFTF